uniref:DNA primase n=1 Tax=Dickeya chrysanthemi TaxID=556 RepID=Q84BA3_DICCH|nr:unknown [Dickeya chrysanthemi]
MEAVLGMMPEEERIQYSAMTGQSLYYLGETSLQHKILAIAEEEGVRQAAYALKLLQSDGELKIASTGKNEQSGELVTREYKVQGPVMLMLTTTASDVDEELLNRCLVLTVNESREQTQAIHAMQRHGQTLAGLLQSSEKQYLTTLHQNAQRLLRPLKVVNPYADRLTFLSDKTRTRRDHMKYLTLIQAIALLHQYQREVKRVEHRGQVIEYIEVEKSDIALANQLHTRCWAGRWMKCRRRRASCWCG